MKSTFLNLRSKIQKGISYEPYEISLRGFVDDRDCGRDANGTRASSPGRTVWLVRLVAVDSASRLQLRSLCLRRNCSLFPLHSKKLQPHRRTADGFGWFHCS